MPKPRGRQHTTVTETAAVVIRALYKQPGIKMIAPGIIDGKRSGKRHITAVFTTGGFELIVSGTGVQKIAVHLINPHDAPQLITTLQHDKALHLFTWHQRERKPGQFLSKQ